MPATDAEKERVLLLGCAFFAVRLYKGLSSFQATEDEYQRVRDRAALASILDAKAVLDAAERAGF